MEWYVFFCTRLKKIHEGLRLLIRFQQPGNNSPRVRHENLERLGKNLDQNGLLEKS